MLARIVICLCNIYFVIKDHGTYAELTPISSSPSVIENGTYTMQCITSLNASFSTWIRNSNDTDSAIIGYRVDTCISTTFIAQQPQLFNFSCFRNETFHIFSLTLKNVSRYQNGQTWKCKYPMNNEEILSNELVVQVLVPVQSLSFDPNKIILKENVNSSISCQTSFSRPRANVTWYINNSTGSTNVYQDSDRSYNMSNTDLVSTISTLYINLNRTYHQWKLVCEAENIQGYDAVSKSVLLNVTYPTKQPTIQCSNNGIYKVVQNTEGELTCSVDGGNPAGVLHWNCTFDTTEDHRGLMNNVTQTVGWTVTEAQYCTCTSRNYAGNRSISVETDMLYPPVIDELQKKTEFEGDSVTLQCVVLQANPNVSIIWWTSNKHSVSGATLMISNISRNDNATYTCTANNTMEPSCNDFVQGSTSRSLHIEVLYPPKVNIPHGQRFTVTEGDRFSYTCPVEHGNPPITNIIWSRSSDTLDSSELLIHNVTRFDDAVYTCYASNVMVNSNGTTRNGNSSADVRLIVQFKTNVTDFYIRGNTNNTTVTVIEQTSLAFVCRLQSNPPSDVLIYEAETLVNKSRANELLYYTKATCSGGPVNYSCLGNNSLSNTPSTRQVELVANCTPRRDMDVHELVAAGAIHETVTLSYTALAYPLPSFTWYRNASTIDTTDPRTFVSSTDFQTKLTIDHLIESDFGVYTVIVANNIGFINESFNLKPQGIPEVPTNLRQDVNSTTESKMSIYWTSGFNNGIEQTFTILFRKHPESSEYTWIDVSVPDKGRTGTTQHYNMSGLSSDTNYDIVLFAVNAIGPSKANATLTGRTKESAVTELSNTSKNISAIVGCTLAVMFVLCGLVVVTFIYRKRFLKDKRLESSTDQPVTYENLKIEQLLNTPLDYHGDTSNNETPGTNVDTCNTYEGLSREDNEKESEYTQLGNTSHDDAIKTYENLKIQLSSCQPSSCVTSAI